MKNKPIRKLLGFDLDGTLCKEICWTPEECLKATPNKKIIDMMNERYNDSITIVYTARKDALLEASVIWLRENGCHYWAISNQKIPFDVLYDDHVININDLK